MNTSVIATTKRLVWVGALATAVSTLAAPAHAQSSCGVNAQPERAPGQRSWAPPLDRVISLHVREVSLRDALDRAAAAGHLRLSYHTELLPLDQRVCLSLDSATVGNVLAALLTGTHVAPLTIGGDQVVLAPGAPRGDRAPVPSRGVNVLERVVVTGSATGVPRRSLAVSLDVLDRSQLARRSSGTFSQLVDGAIPGVWLWEQSPSSLMARYGSIRGASSFGVSYPKVYIDGIEVANSLLVTTLSPDVVERVEVIRGPQGAALYGADAISGVINIVTRHDGAEEGERMSLRSAAGFAHSDFASRPVMIQEQTLNLRTGSSVKSAGLSLAGGSIGSFMPGARSWELRGNGDFRYVGTRATVSGMARLYGKNAGVADNPFLAATPLPQMSPARYESTGMSTSAPRTATRPQGPGRAPESDDQAVRQYTLGTTAMVSAGERWTYSATVGLDGYRLSNATVELTPIPSATDSALRAARGGADRGTVRVSSVGRFGGAPGGWGGATLTLAAEHSALHERTAETGMFVSGDRERDHVRWRSSSGVVGQVDLAMRDDLFLSGGLRLERNDGFVAGSQIATLPMLGSSYVRDFGGITAKVRGAYGKGIRPARTAMRESWYGRQLVWQQRLAPEEQSGVEGGVDAFMGKLFAVHVTRFDQRAFGLIQPVVVDADPSVAPYSGGGPGSDKPRVMFALENVGEITNRGWEIESSLSAGALSLTGTLSLVDSKVRRAAADYRGDLRAGDRMLGVPAQTLGIAAAWTARRWFASLNLTRASDWVNYDGVALTATFADTTMPAAAMMGANLRSYWRHYSGVTRLEATLGRDLMSGLSLVLNGRNLLDTQRGEPDNITIVPGRTITAGLRAHF